MRVYCLDTNALIEPWNKYYTITRCPEYWGILDQLALDGRIFCTWEVKREIEKTDDALSEWTQARQHMFREETSKANTYLREILARFPRLIDSSKGRSMADPWVIAHAMADAAIVVTKELPVPRTSEKIKIPTVCEAFGVEWMDDFAFIDEVGIRFSATLG